MSFSHDPLRRGKYLRRWGFTISNADTFTAVKPVLVSAFISRGIDITFPRSVFCWMALERWRQHARCVHVVCDWAAGSCISMYWPGGK